MNGALFFKEGKDALWGEFYAGRPPPFFFDPLRGREFGGTPWFHHLGDGLPEATTGEHSQAHAFEYARAKADIGQPTPGIHGPMAKPSA